jgi:hypothetical protein
MVCFRHIIVNTLHKGDNKDDDDDDDDNDDNKNNNNSINIITIIIPTSLSYAALRAVTANTGFSAVHILSSEQSRRHRPASKWSASLIHCFTSEEAYGGH